MTILKELVVVGGSYTDKSGNEKKRWRTVGHLHEGTKGQYITLDPITNLAAIPRKEGDDRVYVNLFDPKPREGQAPRETAQDAAAKDFDDDLKF